MRCHLGVRQERCNQPWNHDDNELPPIGAGEREEMVAADALDSERVIHARLKQCQMRAPKAKQHAGRKELGPVVARVDGEPCGELGGALLLNRRIELFEERTATNEIHGTPIVRDRQG